MKLEDFDYALPPELIAQVPALERTGSRLLHLDGTTGNLRDFAFGDIAGLIGADDVLVLNDTRVIKARLLGRKVSGGRIEVLVERILSHDEVLAQVRVSHPPREGSRILLADALEATVLERRGGFVQLKFEGCEDVLAALDRYGTVPLPPYIEHAPEDSDEERYQTVYARSPGAVAAPTAGLHFDGAFLGALRDRGVTIRYITLHVGAGTFQPVRSSDIAEHDMHSEWYSVPQDTAEAIRRARERGGRVVAVGTTTLRALETAAAISAPAAIESAADPVRTNAIAGLEPGTGETKLFIVPGYRFLTVDRLVTNFHLPKSTLLMLVSAFGGLENIRRAYRHAIEQRYRFYSYGDAMLIDRSTPAMQGEAFGR
jgi:S-adenosylmethionine:tRNA ribosyltransferase-isomerase